MSQPVRLAVCVVLLTVTCAVYGQESLHDVFTDEACEIACFMGLEPLQTSKEEVEAFFKSESITYTWSVTGYTTFYDFDLPDHQWVSGGLISIGGSHIAEILFDLHEPVAPDMVFQEFGYPTHIKGIGRPFVILYTDMGLFFHSVLDSDLIAGVGMRQLSAMGIYVDLPPCEELTICDFPTRQEVLATLVTQLRDLLLSLRP